MEYQFIRDPITGCRMLISDEHSNIARWFNEQLNPQYDEVKKFYVIKPKSSNIDDLLVIINKAA